VGDATHLEAEDATYDAVFDFGIIHHIPNWKKALAEIWRVLKPGGRLYAEEALRDLISQQMCRALFNHPWDDPFDHDQFIAGLHQAGFQVVASRRFRGWFGWYFARKETCDPQN